MEPMITETVGNVLMEVFYDSPNFTVKCQSVDGTLVFEETFRAAFEPRFGIDVDDMNQIYTIAEKLANKIEPIENSG